MPLITKQTSYCLVVIPFFNTSTHIYLIYLHPKHWLNAWYNLVCPHFSKYVCIIHFGSYEHNLNIPNLHNEMIQNYKVHQFDLFFDLKLHDWPRKDPPSLSIFAKIDKSTLALVILSLASSTLFLYTFLIQPFTLPQLMIKWHISESAISTTLLLHSNIQWIQPHLSWYHSLQHSQNHKIPSIAIHLLFHPFWTTLYSEFHH